MAATVPQDRASRQGGKRRSGRSCPAWFPAVACMVAGGVVSGVLAALFALVLSLVDLPEMAVTVGILLILAVGAAVMGRLCGRAFPGDRGIVALICGLAMVLVLVALNLIFFREPVTGYSFAKYGAVLLPAFLASVLTRSRRRKSKKKIKKR